MMELKATYWHHFEEGALTSDGYITLNEAASRALDGCNEPIDDWTFIKGVLPVNNAKLQFLTKLVHLPCIGAICRKLMFVRL
jgi:hypothetical protein